MLGTENKSGRQSSKGEFDWIESPEQLRTRMFRLVLMYQTLHGVKVCMPATKHHRCLSLRSPGISLTPISYAFTNFLLTGSEVFVGKISYRDLAVLTAPWGV